MFLCCQGHRNFVTHLDWSEDNRYLQSVSGDYDLLFCEYLSVNSASLFLSVFDFEMTISGLDVSLFL